jgi:hypothetical protein
MSKREGYAFIRPAYRSSPVSMILYFTREVIRDADSAFDVWLIVETRKCPATSLGEKSSRDESRTLGSLTST